MTDEAGAVGKAIRWRLGSALAALLVACLAAPLALPLAYLAEHGISVASVAWVAAYFASLPGHADYWLAVHRLWITNSLAAGRPPLWLAVPPAFGVIVLGAGIGLNPHSSLLPIFGDARWATRRDVRSMRLRAGWIIVLGRWRGRLMMLPETLSALCIAPPGTGKTAAVVVPTILTCDGASMIINDVKPELHALTSGHRDRLGPVFRLEWAAEDDPARGIVFPRWNPLSPRCMPASGPQRDLYIDRLAAVLIPDPTGSADPHWSRKGRAALAGFIHFIVDKGAAGNVSALPAHWHGREACFAMLLDWMTEATLQAGTALERLREDDPNAGLLADPLHLMLNGAVQEALDGGYARRAIQELTQLANTPDRERGSILSAMDAGLAVFKNAAVRQRTAVSDFTFADLRGMRDPRRDPRQRGRLAPVTVYLCVNQQDARALGVVTGLFIEALSAYLIAHPPNAVDAVGKTLGPFPVLFVLDEFPQMPKLQALIDGPAVGRGQKVSYLLIGQDFGQIEEKYGKTGVETLLSTTAAKIVLPLNNDTVAKRFSDMVGNRTHESEAKSRTFGFSRQANPFAVTVNKSLQAVPLIHPAEFMSMRRGTQVVLLQGYANRPIRAETPLYFRDSHLRRRAWDGKRRRGIPPCPPMPRASQS